MIKISALCVAVFLALQLLGAGAYSSKSFRFGRTATALSAVGKINGVNGETPKRILPDKDMECIYEKNQVWKQQKLDEDADFFKTLGSVHKPDYMWIGK
jgi:carbonic anhydrase